MAERGNKTIVVGQTPFAEDTREPVDKDGSPRVRSIPEHRSLGAPLAPPVRMVQLRFCGGGKKERSFPTRPSETGHQFFRQLPVPRVILLGVLRTVHPGQVKNEISGLCHLPQFFPRIPHIEPEDLHMFKGSQSPSQVSANKTFCPRHQYTLDSNHPTLLQTRTLFCLSRRRLWQADLASRVSHD
ncbi:hypothetical protein CEB3_c05790 [Peptococcaceae bacterium CEB3]|nr:hypothetical protein CEB3_c05790 [Peptococcaceae bacterium CEB3]